MTLPEDKGTPSTAETGALQNAKGRPRETNGGEERITASSGNGKGATGSRLRGNLRPRGERGMPPPAAVPQHVQHAQRVVDVRSTALLIVFKEIKVIHR